MSKLKNGFLHAFLLLYVFVTLYPLFWGFQNSFKRHVDIVASPFSLIKNFTLDNYANAWTSANIGRYFVNSLYISVVASVVTIVLASMTAYALTRMYFPKMNKIVTGVFLLAIMIPAGSLLIPLYRFILNVTNDLHIPLYDTHLALILPYIAFGLSLSIIIIMAFIKSLPRELEEAGVMDGLTIYGLFWKIVLPLMTPAIVTVFIINFLGHWNEYVLANVMLSKEALRTLPVAMAAMNNGMAMNYGALLAATMFSIVPVVVIYAILQEKIIEGLAAGSVKG
ncbi:carbohydrate ABC transporter permease [Paenibacillus chitinolyticus]|uniref:Carbohydrate ABC transporter permease n=1 Tax=Paenibacillus chitinolyticus TaxID=79263 RepID=A0A410X1S4_9BACL|nr:carbohydrate ABC transporter permease [Paenibacillus chitinolyticus]MCY9592655.1 carbohydrate ABC transporter permease [Paenibacillus chitinolyticus]MCY9594742.1 carbohydrate ABC transporter permease [Paenibacillus chitinolyticus]QAV20566.1 carbohydrate ABC transporter permease [Paenibacillus chitinolyticus]